MLCTLHSRRNAGYSINSFVVAPAEKAVRDAPRCLGVSDAQVHEYVHAYCTLAAGVGSNSVASKRNGNDSHPKGGGDGGRRKYRHVVARGIEIIPTISAKPHWQYILVVWNFFVRGSSDAWSAWSVSQRIVSYPTYVCVALRPSSSSDATADFVALFVGG
jgi:hypothetical protein